MDLRIVLIGVLFVVAIVFFLLRLRFFVRYSREKRRVQDEIDSFLTNFNPSELTDFAFKFQLGSFSHVSPFPSKTSGEWRYTIYLAKPESEEDDTIVHEIVECTLGRVIERLLELKKPLYLHRKREDKFWINGQQQKYLLEHLLATIAEFDEIPKEKQEERIAAEDIRKWQLGN